MAATKAGAPTGAGLPGGVVRCVGIDPGATTGLVCLDVPRRVALAGVGFAESFDVSRARWVDAAVVRPSASAKLSRAEAKATLYLRVRDLLAVWRPALVVLEDPADAGGAWTSQSRRVGAGRQRSTSFGLGAHYGLALAAARAVSPDVVLASYPVTNWDGRPGWMQDGGRRVPNRDGVLARLALGARALGAPAPESLGEDVRMALGVLLFHLSREAPPNVVDLPRPDAADAA